MNIKGEYRMNITDVKIRKVYTDNRLRALVSITIDEAIAIHDIKIIQGPTRVFIAMPSRKEENGTYRDIVHPISSPIRKTIEETILSEYDKYLSQHSGELSDDNSEE